MDSITNTITAVAAKPATGVTLSIGATILHWIGILTPVLTFITLIIGLAAGVYSLIHQRNKVKMDALEIQNYRKKHSPTRK